MTGLTVTSYPRVLSSSSMLGAFITTKIDSQTLSGSIRITMKVSQLLLRSWLPELIPRKEITTATALAGEYVQVSSHALL
jgi:hypothetical protein